MGFYSVWPYFAGMGVILALARTPLFGWADTPPTTVPARVTTIDGLRGFLALGVVFHHGAIYHQYLQTGTWRLPPTRFYANLGQVGVALFFMITGFLFWTKMLEAKGRPNFPKLYVGRIFRIIPLYLFLVAIVLLAVGVSTGWRLNEPAIVLVKQTAKWLAGGAFIGGDVNVYAGTGLISAYVTWSLHYEWLFYASLMVTAFCARNTTLGALAPLAGLLFAAPLLHFHPNNMSLACALLFSCGMTAASAKRAFAERRLDIPQWCLSSGAIISLILVLALFDGVYSTLPILLLGFSFMAIAFDATIFGLLSTRPAKRLGDISYGVYLLQGPVLFLAFERSPVRSMAMQLAWLHWTILLIAALALILLATVAHVLIERPGVQAGQWLLARWSLMRRPSAISAS